MVDISTGNFGVVELGKLLCKVLIINLVELVTLKILKIPFFLVVRFDFKELCVKAAEKLRLSFLKSNLIFC